MYTLLQIISVYSTADNIYKHARFVPHGAGVTERLTPGRSGAELKVSRQRLFPL